MKISDDEYVLPDLAVIEPIARESWPTTALLVVEVAETSQMRDREKGALYAAVGVVEYWIVDLAARLVTVHREPSGPRSGSPDRPRGTPQANPPPERGVHAVNLRAVAPMLYGAAVVLALLVGGGKALTVVAVVGAMLLAAFYVATRPQVAEDYDRSAAREARRERRAGR